MDSNVSNENNGFDQPPQTQQPQPNGQPLQQYGHVTTVIVNQTAPSIIIKRDWRSGKLSCFDDCGICVAATFCCQCYGCYLVMEAEENCCLACCCPGWMLPLRSFVRGKLGIQGSICNDACAVSHCGPCVMCQLGREIKESKASGEWYQK